MKFTQDQKAKFFGTAIKSVAGIAFAGLIGFLIYNVATA